MSILTDIQHTVKNLISLEVDKAKADPYYYAVSKLSQVKPDSYVRILYAIVHSNLFN
jgi:hypothetical protein